MFQVAQNLFLYINYLPPFWSILESSKHSLIIPILSASEVMRCQLKSLRAMNIYNPRKSEDPVTHHNNKIIFYKNLTEFLSLLIAYTFISKHFRMFFSILNIDNRSMSFIFSITNLSKFISAVAEISF